MSDEAIGSGDPARGGRARTAALAIGVPSLLSVLLMAHHPSLHTSGMGEAVSALSRMATVNAFVHGGLILMLGTILFGFVEFSGLLGWGCPAVRGGMVAYGAGALFEAGAAIVNGFVVTRLAAGYAGQPAEALETLRPILRLCFEANQALAQVGVSATSLGIVAWSLALLRRAGAARAIGSLGLAVGVLPVAGLSSSLLSLNVGGMLAVVVAQTVWNLAVAAWLLGGGASGTGGGAARPAGA